MTEPTYAFFDVQRDSKGRIYAILQKQRNTARKGKQLEASNFAVARCPHGLCINGDYGTNPSREEMNEITALLSMMVEDWKDDKFTP